MVYNNVTRFPHSSEAEITQEDLRECSFCVFINVTLEKLGLPLKMFLAHDHYLIKASAITHASFLLQFYINVSDYCLKTRN